jgi:hypothetical protein
MEGYSASMATSKLWLAARNRKRGQKALAPFEGKVKLCKAQRRNAL